MTVNVEQVVISRIIMEKEFVPFLDAGVTAMFFSEKKWKDAWEWTYRYWAEHGEVPGEAAYGRRFPTHDLEPADDPTSALVEELVNKRRRLLVQEGIQESVEAFDGKDTEGAIAALNRMLTSVNMETSRHDVSHSSQFIGDFVRSVLSKKDFGLTGIPTGFPTIDEATGGLQPEQLISIIALPKSGKSTLALAIALAAQRAGKRGAIVTFEMSNLEEQQRYLSIGANINLNNILRNGLTERDRDKAQDFWDEISEAVDLTFIHDTTSTTTVGGIAAKIEQIGNLDFIVIDGAYLMDDENGEDRGSPRALTNITRSLKRLAQKKKITIILTTQALIARTSKKNGTQLGSIGYTSSFAQDSDAVIGLDRDDLTMPTAKLKIIAARSSLGVEVDLTFDYTLGLIEEADGGFGGSTFRSSKVGYADDGD